MKYLLKKNNKYTWKRSGKSDSSETSKLFSRPLLSPDSCDSAEGRGCWFKAAAVAGGIFHSQDSHKPPAHAKQVLKSPYICAFTKESTLSPGNNRENIDDFIKICTECADFVCLVRSWNQRSFIWEETWGSTAALGSFFRLLVWSESLPPHLVGAGEGILGSCTGKTSAPDEANPAGACLSVHSRSALPSSGSHAHIHPELSWPPRWTQRTNVFIWGTPTTCNTDLKLTLKSITCIDRGLIFLSEDKKGFRQTLRYSQVQHTVTLVNQDYAFQC